MFAKLNAASTTLFRVVDPFILLMLTMVLAASLLPVRGEAATVAGWITNAAIMLLFFLHGAKLSRQAILRGFGNLRLHGLVLATTFVVFPLIGLAIKGLASGFLAPTILSGIVFLCLLPSTVQSSIAFTAIARGNVAAAVCSASLSNILGIFLTPVLVGLLMGHTAGISLDSIGKIAGQLLLPFVVGHLMRPWLEGFITRHKSLVGRVDRTSILLVVYTAFSASVVEGLWHKVSMGDLAIVLGLCGLILGLVLALTWWGAKALGFAYAERVVILFCGSKKSLASGVPMASTLFPPAVLGPVILPLMLFHQVQLIACAFIARKLHADYDKLAMPARADVAGK
ncbi:bile acid:sodium symporter family protein [Asticcacaulis sp. EMRT-3]|uniref:bile acid:sodium symporter family protein n=1 Tax=Asticcacaulis sp. EMRT-3 TaxID=3040349 RepID=UPI0024AFF9CD|nr:bile acid:sodium symporter family protein [Asticcacaulis sp. EMRT-3]MDI7773901.1 bile acid:sodium symporter family protein [Asticcacaulis sp. EMRT-3]